MARITKAVNDLYNIAKQNDFDYWCNDILEYNKTLDYITMQQVNGILKSILKGNRSIDEFI